MLDKEQILAELESIHKAWTTLESAGIVAGMTFMEKEAFIQMKTGQQYLSGSIGARR